MCLLNETLSDLIDHALAMKLENLSPAFLQALIKGSQLFLETPVEGRFASLLKGFGYLLLKDNSVFGVDRTVLPEAVSPVVMLKVNQ